MGLRQLPSNPTPEVSQVRPQPEVPSKLMANMDALGAKLAGANPVISSDSATLAKAVAGKATGRAAFQQFAAKGRKQVGKQTTLTKKVVGPTEGKFGKGSLEPGEKPLAQTEGSFGKGSLAGPRADIHVHDGAGTTRPETLAGQASPTSRQGGGPKSANKPGQLNGPRADIHVHDGAGTTKPARLAPGHAVPGAAQKGGPKSANKPGQLEPGARKL